MNFAPGQRVIIRDTEWIIRKSTLLADDGYELTCSGVSNFVRGKESIFITTYEDDIVIVDPKNTKIVVDTSSGYERSLLYIESLLKELVPTDDKIYRAQNAAMDNVPYQFDPALQALKQPRQRILMADAVGLGKTLEAGILTTELIKRGRGKRILVLAVKSMLTQFQKEFWNRFSIPLTRLDSQGIQRVRNKIPANMNPFFYYDKSIISIDTLKQEAQYRTYIEEAYWDIIIIDEAHNVANRNSGSQKSTLAQRISSRCDTLMMLSATPHDGRAASFASLLNMLDPTAISNPNDYSQDDFMDKGLVIRRFKKDVQDQVSSEFKERKIFTIGSSASIHEEDVFDYIGQISFKTIDKTKRIGSELFKTTLIKSLLSSPLACIASVKNRIKKIEALDDNYSDDIDTLEFLLKKLETIDVNGFSKYQRLVALIKKDMKWKKGKDDRIVIFTERLKSLEFLKEYLLIDLKLKDSELVTMTGSMSDIDVNKIVEDFGQEDSKVRILIATDVASEGINLHYLSHRLIHFDIPWSLMVFQQRNGRVDRYGQEKNPEIYYMQTNSTDEEFKGDNRILDILIQKDEQAAKNIGDPSAFVGSDMDKEIQRVAKAMENNENAQDFSDELDKNLENKEFDFLSFLNNDEDNNTIQQDDEETQKTLPTLFDSDLNYTRKSIQYLQQFSQIEARFEDDRIELHATEDLKYRFKMLPREVYPDNGYFILTDDLPTINQEIKNSRKNESAWPNIHYLWEQHPVMEWIKDKLLSNFDRLEAPVLTLHTLQQKETIFMISGLIPNKKAQPVINEWIGVCFENDKFNRIINLDDLINYTKLKTTQFPNQTQDVDTKKLQELLPTAIQEAQNYIEQKRDEFESSSISDFIVHEDKLNHLKSRHIGQMELDFSQESKKLDKQREIDNIFNEYHNWIKETMEIEKKAFIQVVAVLKGDNS